MVKVLFNPEVFRVSVRKNPRLRLNAIWHCSRAVPKRSVRAWFIQSVTPRFKEALRWMAANRKAYHVVDERN
ncbi:hypothetical protein ACNKHU_15720 [Shigella flexneri]